MIRLAKSQPYFRRTVRVQIYLTIELLFVCQCIIIFSLRHGREGFDETTRDERERESDLTLNTIEETRDERERDFNVERESDLT